EWGEAMGHEALRLAVDAHYRLLIARAHLHLGLNSELAGDQELNEELVMNTERELLRGDSPLIRIINTRAALSYIEESFSRPYLAATSEQESVGWSHLAGDQREEILNRMRLGITKIHLGAMSEAQTEFQAARAMSARLWPGEQTTAANNREILTRIAEALLERGETAEARRCLQAALALRGNSDTWMLSKSASVTGQLQLEQNNYVEAEQVLKTEILRQEGKSADQSSPAGAGAVQNWGIAEQDHDLYGELAAVWLAQGRPGEDVLALWERFRLRSQDLPIQFCPERRLDCERQALEVERQRMGRNRLTGEIVLMDRVLIYAMDEHGVHWQTRKYRRQDLLVAVKAMEGAVSSPLASSTTIELLGRPLADELLPEWPQELSSEATLFIEPDLQLNSLAWSVLPTNRGALGLRYAVAETPSILAHSAAMQSATQRISLSSTQSDARPLVIGASITGEGTPPLPEAIEEAQGVGAFLHAPELLLGSHATARNVAAALSHASLLHFAGHAVQDDWGTRLLLANEPQADARLDAPPQPSWIDESFLRKHPPRACRLAVLSACATGGNVPSGDTSPRDLVKIFYSLGVPEVVATRWPVDSAASVSFMKAFYSRLESGQDVAHALQSARQSLFHGSTYGNSYFWGAYYATGQEEFPIEGERHAGVKDRSGNERAQKRSLQRGR
ncbi:MAG TPA: CHAT domain-containing protein, partial [Acidobacteriaceae bacterium]|nr:CHAT domain-containing protein [Acidobacteriaceae bacterium]